MPHPLARRDHGRDDPQDQAADGLGAPPQHAVRVLLRPTVVALAVAAVVRMVSNLPSDWQAGHHGRRGGAPAAASMARCMARCMARRWPRAGPAQPPVHLRSYSRSLVEEFHTPGYVNY